MVSSLSEATLNDAIFALNSMRKHIEDGKREHSPQHNDHWLPRIDAALADLRATQQAQAGELKPLTSEDWIAGLAYKASSDGDVQRVVRDHLLYLRHFYEAERAAPQAGPAVPHPDWSQAPEWAMWWSVSADGRSWWHQTKPEEDASGFVGGWKGQYAGKVYPDWRTTLRSRPNDDDQADSAQEIHLQRLRVD